MNALALASQTESKDIKLTGKKTLDSKSSDEKNLFENIIASLVIDEKNEEKGSFLLSKLLNLSSDTEKDEQIISDFSKGDLLSNSQSEHISIQDLLQISITIKEGGDPATFPTDSKSLKLALSKPDVIEQLKDAKNIKELLDVAKKNNIEVKNFQFFQEETALNPKDKKIIQKLKSEDIFKLIKKQVTTKNTQTISTIDNIKNNTKDFIKNEKSNTNILQTILSSELSVKKESNIQIDKVKLSKTKVDIKESKIINNKIDTNQDIKISKETDIQIVTKEKTISTKPLIQEKIISKKVNKLKVNKNNKEIIEKKTEKSVDTKLVSTKIEDIKQSIVKSNFKNKLQSLVQTSNGISKTDIQKEQPLIQKQDITSETTIEDHTKTITPTEQKTLSVDKIKNDNHEVKKTFNTFAQEFKEKVENYKPPLMKIKMELKPAGLGEVDVTLLSRGNNLQVNINSNASTIAIFTQNQVEFKNSLVNMGFSDLQMNFGENNKKGQEQQKQNSKNSFEQFEEEQNEQDGFEMTIPRYV
jgi:hypothetical protein